MSIDINKRTKIFKDTVTGQNYRIHFGILYGEFQAQEIKDNLRAKLHGHGRYVKFNTDAFNAKIKDGEYIFIQHPKRIKTILQSIEKETL